MGALAMSECRFVEGDPDALYPPQTGRQQPGTTEAHHHDLASLDCAGTGVTITNVVGAIATEDDDGLLTLGTNIIDADGLGFTQFVTTDPDPTDRAYSVAYAITLSDTTNVIRDEFIPVLATRRPNA